jgi:D-3-phosphoglycerate dehydrogenase
VAKFKIATPTGASFTVEGGGYDYEMEALDGMDAEIVEGPTDEDGFIKFAQDADAIYAKGIRITKKIIDGLPARCRAIVLGSVGVDSVDVVAATDRGIPVTNCPDTFIEEVADHAMMLLLASFRRTIEQDRMVREGKWREGRPALLQIPRLNGQTLGLIAFGDTGGGGHADGKAFPPDEEDGDIYQHRTWPDGSGVWPDQGFARGMDRPCWPRRSGD